MKVALVHDYLKEFGGAERVLEALCEIFPKAPIYTSFCVKNSIAGKAFADKKIITSWGNWFLPKAHLYSILRFLTPLIWESFDFSDYDLVVSSSSWYITKGIKVKKPTTHLCYCHTPPRWLYGYQKPIEWRKFWPIRLYGEITGHFLRQYDYQTSQKVDYFIANSKEVAGRIKKFYRRDPVVIYPPVDLTWEVGNGKRDTEAGSERWEMGKEIPLQNPASHVSPLTSYFLVVSRLEGTKNIDLAISACNSLKESLWIVGTGGQEEYLKAIAGPTIKFLGRMEDSDLWEVYKSCKALICTSTDEDFGMTPVEAMLAGRPVIAFRGGGYLETVIEGKTGIFFDESTVESLSQIINHYNNIYYHSEIKMKQIEKDCRKQAKKFSKERFKKEIKEFIKKYAGVA